MSFQGSLGYIARCYLKKPSKIGVVVHSYNPSYSKREAGGLKI
jgi:hypothetical protein